MKNLYYIKPTDKIFDEVKREAIKIWQTYDNTYGYVDEKVNRIKDITNVEDNMMYMVAMFDMQNQSKLAHALSTKARKAIADRLKAGGQPDNYNPFLLLEDYVWTE